MRSFVPVTLAFLLSFHCGAVSAGPILLATGSGASFMQTTPATEAVEVTSSLRYQALVGSGVSYDLFEHERLLVWRENPPFVINRSVASPADDPDFEIFTNFLTDGMFQLLFLVLLPISTTALNWLKPKL